MFRNVIYFTSYRRHTYSSSVAKSKSINKAVNGSSSIITDKSVDYPIYKNGAKTFFYPTLVLGIMLSIGVAEVYWRFYVIPRRDKRDKWFKDRGIEYKPLIEI